MTAWQRLPVGFGDPLWNDDHSLEHLSNQLPFPTRQVGISQAKPLKPGKPCGKVKRPNGERRLLQIENLKTLQRGQWLHTFIGKAIPERLQHAQASQFRDVRNCRVWQLRTSQDESAQSRTQVRKMGQRAWLHRRAEREARNTVRRKIANKAQVVGSSPISMRRF
jgi:hypothetical protein